MTNGTYPLQTETLAEVPFHSPLIVYYQDFQPRLVDIESGSANIIHVNFCFETDLLLKFRDEKKSN